MTSWHRFYVSQTSKPDPHAVLDDLLPAAVREATGRSDVEPRPGQIELSHEVLDRMLAVGEPSRSASDVATQSLAGAPTGSGKALALDTPIPTPDGWTTIGQLEAGDYVLDHLGAPTLVTSVSDVQEDRMCFEVRVGDGAPVVADAEHLWPVLGLPAHHGSLAERVAADLGVSADSMWGSQVLGVLAEQQAYSQTSPYRTLTTARLAEMIADGATPCGLVDDSRDKDTYSVTPTGSVPVRCIMVDSPARLFLAGRSRLVTHNSLAYLTPLFLDVVTNRRRGVVSTESLSLQAQIADKDAPAVARAVEKTLGEDPPTFAILKGWSNYGCVSRAAGTVAQLLGLSEDGQDVTTVPNLLSSLEALIDKDDQDPVQIDDREYDPKTLLPLTKWVLKSATAMDATGDRDSYPGNRSPEDWQQVSVTPDDCVGADRCPFASICLPKKAQEEAAAADVVVTNHAMLAVQAANNVPVVLGSNKLGVFDHLVIDEAHALPSIVRGAGARSISAATVMRLVRILHRHCATNESAAAGEKVDREAQGLVDLGEGLAVSVDKMLDRKIADQRRKSRHGAAVIGVDPDDEAPLGELGDALGAWARRVLRALPVENPAAPLPPTQAIALKRARADVSRFITDLDAVLTHEVAHARWIQDGDPTRRGRWMGASLRSSPVDVAGDISNNLFTADVVRDQDDDSNPWGKVSEHRWVSDEDPVTKKPPRYRLSATAVSATLPKSFAFDTGMAVKAKPYPSPFMDAYKGSALYIPMVKDLEEAVGFTRTWPGSRRPSFDVSGHPEWAAGQIVNLVAANGGRALILAATVAAGKRYAETLRVMMPGLVVHSQWDGRPVRHVLRQWREDETSVMVGTKSLMTGVDAPGQTCSLVILDRVPRDAGNPVDDARVEAVMERGGMDKWSADRHVYVADAALRVDQASGRLIRAGSDRGMFALLDPRMLKFGVVTYAEPTRRALMEPLTSFGTKISKLNQAVDWLAEQQRDGSSSPLAS